MAKKYLSPISNTIVNECFEKLLADANVNRKTNHNFLLTLRTSIYAFSNILYKPSNSRSYLVVAVFVNSEKQTFVLTPKIISFSLSSALLCISNL